MAKSKEKEVTQSDECRALQEAIDAHAEAFRHRDEKRDALAKTEQALLELDGFLKNAERDLEQGIVEASDSVGGDATAVLPDRAATHCERILRLKSQIEFHAKVRDKLKADLNVAAMGCKFAIDALEVAKRPLLQQVSAQLAEEIEILETQSSALRDQLRGMSNSAPDGLDGLAPRALMMMQGFLPPPTDDPMVNSPRWHKTNAWAAAYRNWRKALETDTQARPPESP
jgi:hypothetical protein